VNRATVFERHLPPDHSLLGPLRHDVAAELADRAAPSLVSDAVLVISELTTNAITAARTSSEDVVVRVRAPEDDELIIEVEDNGPGFAFDDRMTRRPRGEDERGRGLRIVEAVADDVQVDRVQHRTRVRALLRRHEPLKLAGNFK
jgi:anti-sigma regulatory factor (Ser/Thr protein kinase)